MKNIFSNKYKKKYLLIVFIMIDVVLISIAYAVLSTSLKVKVSSVSNAESIWNVHFKTETVTATSTGSNNGHSCGTASSSGNTVTINNTTLSKPNDKCVWELTIQNEGTIDAEIAQMVVTNPTGTDVTCTQSYPNPITTCGNIIYKLSSISTGTGAYLPIGTTISKRQDATTPGTLKIYLFAYYYGSSTPLNVEGKGFVQKSAKFTINFTQK